MKGFVQWAFVFALFLSPMSTAWGQDVATRTVYSGSGVTAELDYDGANRIVGARVINTTGRNVYMEVEQISNGRKYGAVFLAGTTTVIPIPTGIGQRITQFLDDRGFWDGLNIRVLDPAP